MPTIRKITDWQGIYRNVPAIVWKKGLQVVRESKSRSKNPEMDSGTVLCGSESVSPLSGIEIPEYRKDDMEELRLIHLNIFIL